MKAFYEQEREACNEPYIVGGQYAFPSHFHANLEIYVLKRGSVPLTVNGEGVTVKGGEICVVDSYEIHANGDRSEDAELKVVIVPFSLLAGFNAKRKNMTIKNRVINNPELCDEIYALICRYLESDEPLAVKNSATEFILSLICENLTFGDSRYGEESSLIRKILTYLHANYKGGASLKEVSLALGYTEAHLSRVFHKYVKTNVTKYVNGLRYQEVQDSIKGGVDKKTVDIIYEAGFKSQQTYYRFKQEIEGE